MFNRNNKKFPTILFVMASLFALLVFFMMMSFLLSNSRYNEINKSRSIVNRGISNKLFLNKDYSYNDPYMTKIPNLRDMLKGPIITNLDPVLGDINTEVMLVLFSDFECSYCAKQEKVLKDAVEKYNIALVWKDYPASDIASRSYKAAIAARCAQTENAFWDYHDLLFTGDSDISNGRLLTIAEDLHLDIDEFSDCLDNYSTSQLVNDNILEAEALGINGIPFLYVNDQEILGEINKAELEQLIELELAKYEENGI